MSNETVLRAAAKVYLGVVAALGEWTEDKKETYFEAPPSKNPEAYNRWMALNEAGKVLKAAIAESESPTVAQPAAEQQAPVGEHEFKNFHRLLCERFGYVHDERDWKRDQLSLIEWIAKRVSPPAQPASSEPAAPDTEAGLMEDVDALANWLDAKWIRHKELEDRDAAKKLRDLAAAYRASEQRCRGLEADAGRLDWLEQFHDGFYNIDRITAVRDVGFNRLPTLRAAIDAAINSAKGGK